MQLKDSVYGMVDNSKLVTPANCAGVFHCGMPTGRRNCVEGEWCGTPHQGRAGIGQVLTANPARASRRAGPGRPSRPRCCGVGCEGR
jgi:hypothetical protein